MREAMTASLLERAIEEHGGRDAWHGRDGFEIDATVGGVAWPLRTRRAPGFFRGRVRTAEPWMEILDYPREGCRGVFEPHRVRIEDEEGAVISAWSTGSSTGCSCRRSAGSTCAEPGSP